ncbi:MAG: phage holin family protein [archaeon]|nr:phage holin family protein [archaeon]
MDITFILEFVITCISLLFTMCLLPYFENKFGVEKITHVFEIVKIVVRSVEQVTKLEGAGKSKKAEVIRRLKEDYNIVLDEQIISDLIESAVLDMNNEIIKMKEEKENHEKENEVKE